MSLYAVLPVCYDDKIYYRVLRYNLKGTIVYHFKFCKGFISLIPFLLKCRLTEKQAKKLAIKLEREFKDKGGKL